MGLQECVWGCWIVFLYDIGVWGGVVGVCVCGLQECVSMGLYSQGYGLPSGHIWL